MREKVTRKYVPIEALIAHPNNYKKHPEMQLHDLKASLIRFGQVKPVVAQVCAGGGEYLLIAGHGITQAAKQLLAEDATRYAHFREWDVVLVPASWSSAEIKGYMVSDNETGNKATDDEVLLAQLLEEQLRLGFDLASVGSDEESLRQMLESLESEQEEQQATQEEASEVSTGNLLGLLDITIAEPRHSVQHGDVWQLGKHTLLCAHVLSDWKAWTPYLQGDKTLFLPFAGPLVPLSQKADTHTLIMIQPDTYIAGHVLDRYADIHGERAVKKTTQITVTTTEEEEEHGDE